mmetsp:Transcript_30887/g.88551  ORF Transcript_30887/g.88551 Transcript_30887/m.88551 type:complete len:274 (+) Transcript_30887:188-1009(+)
MAAPTGASTAGPSGCLDSASSCSPAAATSGASSITRRSRQVRRLASMSSSCERTSEAPDAIVRRPETSPASTSSSPLATPACKLPAASSPEQLSSEAACCSELGPSSSRRAIRSMSASCSRSSAPIRRCASKSACCCSKRCKRCIVTRCCFSKASLVSFAWTNCCRSSLFSLRSASSSLEQGVQSEAASADRSSSTLGVGSGVRALRGRSPRGVGSARPAAPWPAIPPPAATSCSCSKRESRLCTLPSASLNAVLWPRRCRILSSTAASPWVS